MITVENALGLIGAIGVIYGTWTAWVQWRSRIHLHAALETGTSPHPDSEPWDPKPNPDAPEFVMVALTVHNDGPSTTITKCVVSGWPLSRDPSFETTTMRSTGEAHSASLNILLRRGAEMTFALSANPDWKALHSKGSTPPWRIALCTDRKVFIASRSSWTIHAHVSDDTVAQNEPKKIQNSEAIA